MLYNQARETNELRLISYPVQSHEFTFHFCTSHSLNPTQHLLTPPKHIKTNPSNSDVGISSLNTFRPETPAEMHVVVQTIIRRDGKRRWCGDKCGSGKGE
jgi:hypothetical protein